MSEREMLFKMASEIKVHCLEQAGCGGCVFCIKVCGDEACAIDTEPDQWELEEVEIKEVQNERI